MLNTLLKRIRVKIKVTNSCWEWMGWTSRGYGMVCFENRDQAAHRVVYRCLVGDIPKGLQLDHLCRNKKCVKPNHLEPVTARVNTLRCPDAPATINSLKVKCIKGHNFDAENTGRDKYGDRYCKKCCAIHSKNHYRKKNPNYGLDNRLKTHCPKNHPLIGENLMPSGLKQRKRACRKCNIERQRNKRRIKA